MRAARTFAAPVAGLSPANFAIVMATGVIGVDAQQQGYDVLGEVLLAIALVAWLALAAMSTGRLLWHREHLLADLRSHQRAPGFLTTVAGTSVLGSLWLVLGLPVQASALLCALALALWLVLTYGILIALTLQRDKPALADAISGAWLLVVVAMQSIAILAVLLAAHAQQPARLMLNFLALAMWFCGGMVYVWLISLIFYRLAFFRFGPEDLAPTSWINMGAMAISALAGAQLVLNAPGAPFLSSLLPVLQGGTVLYWAVGTWWIPLLAGLALWRYVHRRYPLRYEVGYWGVVFPLGMYSAATQQMAQALGVRFLLPVARGFFFLAVAAWLLTAAGLVRQWLRANERRAT
ncbi:tellurite resistance/C4-dicarboxylate transporter family protein [Ramlibacter sp. USB13]|uniref:Tellurite resistance/C4-dicarboxylate transporter family protein n=1 Tax=Ramlibacter cellulosilyticus TaxID=2764187 RepID=A0A923SC42_9BURK|nr:tellurite resistance/C4-dicarboxylate transporter family protein [Ramlibacter cellulosilyticus]MBC5783838.1 tellurite resistance/C4-dicarboxylate transporter family protein [Ramlibacter cellulosilyticus]